MMYGRENFSNIGCFGYGFFDSIWTVLIGIGILLLVITVTYLLVKKSRKTTMSSNALELLKTKFAKGEITEEEYLKRKNVFDKE